MINANMAFNTAQSIVNLQRGIMEDLGAQEKNCDDFWLEVVEPEISRACLGGYFSCEIDVYNNRYSCDNGGIIYNFSDAELRERAVKDGFKIVDMGMEVLITWNK